LKYYRDRMFRNIPMRENPDDVDQFLRYSEVTRIIETLHARALRKMVLEVIFRGTRELRFLMGLTSGLGSSGRLSWRVRGMCSQNCDEVISKIIQISQSL
jgi:hypothetical protein